KAMRPSWPPRAGARQRPRGEGAFACRGPRRELPVPPDASSVARFYLRAARKRRAKIGVLGGEQMTATGPRSILALSLFLLAAAKAQATPASELTVDDAFDPPIAKPAFAPGKGPALVVDQKHRNVVSLETYFRPVGRFLGKDGYAVRPGTETFTAEGLAPAHV